MARPACADTLPVELSSFVGRAREVDEVAQRLRRTRLLTLVGTGGVGKTRLAVRVADVVSNAFRDGVWFVDLSRLSDPALVPQAIVGVLGVPAPSSRQPLRYLIGTLRGQQALIVLDNCEHLAGACAEIAVALLRDCRDVQILATSREPLQVIGEVAWRVPSLSLPQREGLASLAESEAAQLFVERASAVESDFAVSEQNAQAVAEICRRLDGIPLALELAAARLPGLGVRGIVDHLDDRFRLLSGGNRAAPSRQQTLAATLDWSYRLLHVRERRLLDRLAVFHGGWTLAAAEHVCSGPDDLQRDEVLDSLLRLVSCSLVVAEPSADGSIRYRLLESVRAYAQQRLVDAPDQTNERHAAYYLALAEQAEPELRAAAQIAWLRRLELEHANLRAALQWLLDHTEVIDGLRLAAALARFWYVRGHLEEGRSWVDRLRVLPRAPGDEAARAAALAGAGNLAWVMGELSVAEDLLQESLHLRLQLDDIRAQAHTYYDLSKIAIDRGDATTARLLVGRALLLWREAADTWGTAVALNMQGEIARELDDLDQAYELYQESLVLFASIGDDRGRAIATHNLALVAAGQDDYEGSEALHRAILPLKQSLGDREGMVSTLVNLAHLAAMRGVHDHAVRLCAAAETERARIRANLETSERTAFERASELSRAALPSALFEAAWAQGASMDLTLAVATALAEKPKVAEATSGVLTPREHEVLSLLASGKSNRQIASQLVLSTRTVERHVDHIYQKIGASGRVARAIATAYAFTHGIGVEDERRRLLAAKKFI